MTDASAIPSQAGVTAFLVSCHLSTWRLAIDLGLAGRNDEQQLVRTAREFGSTPNLDAST